MKHQRLFVGLVALIGALTACGESVTAPRLIESQALAKGAGGGGGGGGGGTTTTGPCATLTVTNSGQTVRNFTPDDIKYNLVNCGSVALAVTVSVVETTSAWSGPCPSPVAAPVQYALDVKAKIAGSAPVYRGPCGFTSNVNGVLVQGVNRWQGHNLLVIATDDATGTVLSSGFFSWQDQLNPGRP
jgi:hypothetical protein